MICCHLPPGEAVNCCLHLPKHQEQAQSLPTWTPQVVRAASAPITGSRGPLSLHHHQARQDQASAATSAYPYQVHEDQHMPRKEAIGICTKNNPGTKYIKLRHSYTVMPPHTKATVDNCFF